MTAADGGGALCGDVLRLYLDPDGTLLPPPDYRGGWLGPWGRGTAHYFPPGTAQSACWRWERPDLWPPVAAAPAGAACTRCRARWVRDQRRGHG